MAEGNEDVTEKIDNAVDESSWRKILIVLYRLKNIVMDALGPVICSTTRNSIVVAQAAAQTVVRDPLRLAMMMSGDRCSAMQVHMTWTEDPTMNERQQCLQRDVTEVDVSRRAAGRTRLMFV